MKRPHYVLYFFTKNRRNSVLIVYSASSGDTKSGGQRVGEAEKANGPAAKLFVPVETFILSEASIYGVNNHH
jgi:hypothetical protein